MMTSDSSLSTCGSILLGPTGLFMPSLFNVLKLILHKG